MRWLIGVAVAAAGCGGSLLADDLLDASPQDGGQDATLIDTGVDVTVPDACATPTTCSSDLHSIVDCTGEIVSACPPDQGCYPGATAAACLPACTAMAQ